MTKLDILAGIISTMLITLFFSGSLLATDWNYGYGQLLIMCMASMVFGAFADRFYHS